LEGNAIASITRTDGDFEIDAKLLVEAFDLTEVEIRRRMRQGVITSLCETGVDEDAGFWRLTFHHGDRACRFIVDAEGTVLKRTRFPIRTTPPTVE
jgi:hypothetical protein